jgi:hypothetical protein
MLLEKCWCGFIAVMLWFDGDDREPLCGGHYLERKYREEKVSA